MQTLRRIGYMVRPVLVAALVFAGSASAQEDNPPHGYHFNEEIARKVLDKFESLDSLQVNFQITTTEGNRNRSFSGRLYYQKPRKLRYEFTQPAGNLIVSDGEILWYYIRRANLVGKQQLNLEATTPGGNSVFSDNPVTGIQRLFAKYHYHFDTTEQPREVHGRSHFVFDMEQLEKIGGYEYIKLFVDAETFLVSRAEGSDGYGKRSIMTFSNYRENPALEGKLFQFRPGDNDRVVPNPFVRPDNEDDS